MKTNAPIHRLYVQSWMGQPLLVFEGVLIGYVQPIIQGVSLPCTTVWIRSLTTGLGIFSPLHIAIVKLYLFPSVCMNASYYIVDSHSI